MLRPSPDAPAPEAPQPSAGDRGFTGATQLAAPRLVETRIGVGASHPVYYLRAVRAGAGESPQYFVRANVGSHWGAEGRLSVRGARDRNDRALAVFLVEDSDGDGGLSQYRDLYVEGYVYETVDVQVSAGHLAEGGDEGYAIVVVGASREVGPLRFDARYVKRFLKAVEVWSPEGP